MSLLLYSSFDSKAPPIVSAFGALVAQVDRTTLEILGDAVTYQPGGVGPLYPVTGIFDAQFVLAEGDANAGAESLGPAVFLLLADLPTDPKVDDPLLTIDGITYHVTERRVAGMGGIVLALRAVG